MTANLTPMEFVQRGDPPPPDPDGVTDWKWISVCSAHRDGADGCRACNTGMWVPEPRPIEPVVGRGPWYPTPTSTLNEADVIHYYEFPLAGVIGDRGYRYLFWEVNGSWDPAGSWFAYVETGSCETELLAAIDTADDFAAIVTVVDHWTRPYTVVLAHCDDGFDITAVETFGTFAEAAATADAALARKTSGANVGP